MSRRHLIFCITLLAASALTSCSGPGEISAIIEETRPADPEQIMAEGQLPGITFTRLMDGGSVEAAVSVSTAAGDVAGTWRWNGRSVSFVPLQELLPGTEYRLEFRGAVLDARGSSHFISGSIPFYAEAGPVEELRVERADPPAGGTLRSPRAEIALSFSAPVGEAQLRAALSVLPSVDAHVSAEGTLCRITPAAPGWSDGTLYSLVLPGGLAAADGRSLAEPFEAVFSADFAAPPLPPPQASAVLLSWPAPFPLSSSDAGAVGEGESVRLLFQRPVLRETVQFAFSLQPHLPGSLYWEDERSCVFLPDPGWEFSPGTVYALTLTEDVEALDGGRLAEGFELAITGAPTPRPVQIDGLPGDGFPYPLPHEDPVPVSPSGSERSYRISWRFDGPINSPSDRAAAQAEVLLQPIFPPDIGYPAAVHFQWPDASTLLCRIEGIGLGAQGRRCYYRISAPRHPDAGYPQQQILLEYRDE